VSGMRAIASFLGGEVRALEHGPVRRKVAA
jgi:hypothetical protein